jgi:hypothetical protein
MTKKKTDRELEHTMGGPTTREPGDLGVPMKPAADPAKETTGPEDALGPEPTRGDYSGRLGNTRHVQVEAIYESRDDRAPRIVTAEQNLVPDPGGPLDAADPNYERLLAQRTEQARKKDGSA